MSWQGKNATMGYGAAGQYTWSPGFSEMSICSELPMSAHWAEAKEEGDTHMISDVGAYIVQQN